jgi:hypothetical protein
MPKLAEDDIKTSEVVQLTVPQTQEVLQRLANPFFPVIMIAHESFSCCSFAHRRPVVEI